MARRASPSSRWSRGVEAFGGEVAGVPTCARTVKSSSPPTGTVVDDVGQLQQALAELFLGRPRGGLGRFTRAAAPWRA